MSAYRRTWWAIGAAALVVSACKDSTAPRLSNPQQLGSNLQTVSSVFASPAFQSFGALDSAPGSPVAASTPAGALISATSVAAPQTPRQPYADAPARLQAFRTTATALGGRLSAQVIPSTIWGKTYVWDVTAHAYAEDPSPAVAGPSTGVRLILYAIDPITRHVVESPLTAVGYVDLVDQSSGNTNQLEVIVKDGTPPNGTTYVDYTVSATVTGSPASSFDATAVGFVTDGTRRIDFNATFSATNLAVYGNGGGEPVAVIRGTADATHNGITITHQDGSQLSPAELEALDQLFELPDRLEEALEHLFHPAERFMGI